MLVEFGMPHMTIVVVVRIVRIERASGRTRRKMLRVVAPSCVVSRMNDQSQK